MAAPLQLNPDRSPLIFYIEHFDVSQCGSGRKNKIFLGGNNSKVGGEQKMVLLALSPLSS